MKIQLGLSLLVDRKTSRFLGYLGHSIYTDSNVAGRQAAAAVDSVHSALNVAKMMLEQEDD